MQVEPPFDRVTYDEAMLRYGTDRPDRRLGMEIERARRRLRGLGVQGLRRRAGGRRRGARDSSRAAPSSPAGASTSSPMQAQSLGREGARLGGGRAGRRLALADREVPEAARRCRPRPSCSAPRPGDAILAWPTARRSRRACSGRCASSWPPPVPRAHDLLWVVDFPMFEWNEDEQRFDALHHPFTAPLAGPRRAIRAPG